MPVTQGLTRTLGVWVYNDTNIRCVCTMLTDNWR